ncbi:MAG: hypothetical protein DRJ56_05825 [Thermoprotei archaeon]|nr:MAG: hypothetical protein DRJ56_05825 [Thermoprotei archaeon]
MRRAPGPEALVIRPSAVISSLCYSILRVEPYPSCALSCPYCYAQWYRAPARRGWGARLVSLFEAVARALSRRGLPTIPFRLSTLAEPLQPAEAERGLSRRVMSICLKYDTPLIVTTKSTLLSEEPWRGLARKLSERGLLVVQVSLPCTDDGLARALEPRAPPPSERLRLAELLSGEGVPVVARLQPLVPGLANWAEEASEAVAELRSAGVRQVVVESLRLPRDQLEPLGWSLGLWERWRSVPWEPYGSGASPFFLRPGPEWRGPVYEAIRAACDRHGVAFATCKEGHYHLWTAADCCGIYMLDGERARLRVTLRELWEAAGALPLPDPSEVALRLDQNKYLHSGNVAGHPRPLRRGVVAHERRLAKAASDPRLVEALLGLARTDHSLQEEEPDP